MLHNCRDSDNNLGTVQIITFRASHSTTTTTTTTTTVLRPFVRHNAECIMVTCVCVSVCPSPHSHTTARTRCNLRGMVGGAPRCWADLQPVHGFRCCDNIVLRVFPIGAHDSIVVNAKCRTIFGRRVFTVAGPTAWNSLPDYLRDPSLSEDTFR